MRSSAHGRRIGEFARRIRRLNDAGTDLPPLSVTKDRGVVLQSEKYNKRIATDPRKYLIAMPGEFVYDAMSLYYGAIGRVTQSTPGLVSPDYVLFEVDESVDHDFLQHFFRSDILHDTYERLAEGGNQHGKRRRIYWPVFESIAVRLPPLDEQRRVAAVLSAIDRRIRSEEAVLRAMQEARTTTATRLLVGVDAAGWPRAAVGDVIERCDYGISTSLSLDSSGVPVLRMGNVADGEVRLDDLKYGPEHEIGDCLLREHDVLFNRTNSAALVGKVGIFRGADRPVSFASYLLRLRADPTRADGRWLGHVLNLPSLQAQLRVLATPGVSQVNINRTKLLGVEVPVPPLDEQHRRVAVIDAAGQLARAQAEVLERLARVRSAVAASLLTGGCP